ncbi:hypothetical protein GGR54DRAFT_470320 [Hypoxylon sp. NC1633]|nr:hypothetical protein GGR54DRAFT_470320 [Hypoxylon sp. NC1633]
MSPRTRAKAAFGALWDELGFEEIFDDSSTQAQADEERESISSPPSPDDHDVYTNTSQDHKQVPQDKRARATTRDVVNRDPKQPIISAASFRVQSTDSTVADLEQYIQTCCYGDIPSSRRRPIFNQGVGHFRPQLEKGRKNRIIVYPGCFNPPHRGHQALINRAFSCTQDIHVVAAIVIPIGDLAGRGKAYGNEVLFTLAERVRLWTGDHGPHDWLWVYPHGKYHWKYFQARLTSAASRDGFRLQFLYLGGPDNVGNDGEVPLDVGWQCRNVLVCDAGRKADFVRADGTLARIEGCRSWHSLSGNTKREKSLVKMASDTAQWLLGSLSFTMLENEAYKGLVKEILLEYTTRMKGVSVCAFITEPKRWVRFIPGGDFTVRVSSTEIRSTILTCPPDELFESLKDTALHPEILTQLWHDRTLPAAKRLKLANDSE